MTNSPNSAAPTPDEAPWPLTEGAAAPAGSLRTQMGRMGRHRWLILAIAVIGAVGAAGYADLQGTTYTGTSALTVVSGSGVPGADADVAQGYVEYFNTVFVNSPSVQAPGIAGTKVSARTSATSSIVYVSATAPSEELAGRSAQTAAQAFRAVVNTGLQQNVDRTVADLTQKLDAVKRSFGSEPPSQSGLVSAQIDELQNQIVQVQSDGSRNQLQDLKLDPVVTGASPHRALNAALGLVGGLILGLVVALVLGGIEDRLITSEDVRRRLGLDTLASISGRTRRLRTVQLKRLATVVGLASARHPATLAVTSVRRTTTSLHIAEGIAAVRAQQGQRTLLINADPGADRSEQDTCPGLGRFLADPDADLTSLVVAGAVRGMLVLPAGGITDTSGLSRPDRWDTLVTQAGRLADLVVIAAPSCAENPEAHAACAAADRTILVLEKGAVRAREAADVCAGLGRVDAHPWAAVIAVARLGKDSAPVAATPLQQPGWPVPASVDDRSNGTRPSSSEDGASARV